MNEVRYSNIAAKIAGYMSLFWVVGIVAGVFATTSLSDKGIATIAILAFPLAFVIDFIALRIVLPKACRQYGLVIRKDGVPVAIRGGALIGLAWGLMWRLTVISIPLNLLAKIVADDDSSAFVGILLMFFGFFLASLWLLKHQLGGTTISKLEIDARYSTDTNTNYAALKEVSPAQVAKEGTTTILTTAAVISYFAIGLVQLAAVVAFFHDYWEWWYVPSILVASFVAYIPLIGAVAGMYAAVEVWGWTWYWAGLLFFSPLVLLVLGAGVAGAIELFTSKFKR